MCGPRAPLALASASVAQYLQLVLQHGDLFVVFGAKLATGGGEADGDGRGQLQVHHRHSGDGHATPRQGAQRRPESLIGVLMEGQRGKIERKTDDDERRRSKTERQRV